jgi:hypothetical protein
MAETVPSAGNTKIFEEWTFAGLDLCISKEICYEKREDIDYLIDPMGAKLGEQSLQMFENKLMRK